MRKKKLTVPESCKYCRYNPFESGCEGIACRDCVMGNKALCKCVSMPEGSVCPYAEYAAEDICPICDEKYTFYENACGIRVDGFNVSLMIWDNRMNKRERHARNCNICPTCGEQLRKCIEERQK